MKATSFFIIMAFSINTISAFSAEVDQYTLRHLEMKDSSELLNKKANAALKIALVNANNKAKGCSEKILYKELRSYFSNHVQGKLTKDILADENIVKRYINLNESVYQDWTIWDGLGMGSKFLSKKAVTMSGEMRVGNQYVGVDKLEHMWGQGYSYFEQNYLNEKGEIKAVKTGVAKEKIYLGGNKLGNGVFSYGDLSANFNGMRFWNHMLLKNDDVLGADMNLGPYIICANDKWVHAADIDFRNYIDDSMNESINCSKFPSQHTADKFEDRLRIMGTSCPVNVQKRDDMIGKYRQMAKWMVNKDGVGKVKYTGEFKNK